MHYASAKNTRSTLKYLCTFRGKMHNKQLKRTINRIVIDNSKHSASPLLLVPLCTQLPPAVLNLANCNSSVIQNIYPVYFKCDSGVSDIKKGFVQTWVKWDYSFENYSYYKISLPCNLLAMSRRPSGRLL